MAAPRAITHQPLLQTREASEIVGGINANAIYQHVTKPSPATAPLARTLARQSSQPAQHVDDERDEPEKTSEDDEEYDEKYVTFCEEKYPEEDVLYKLKRKLNSVLKKAKDEDINPDIVKSLRVVNKMARTAYDMVNETISIAYEQYQDEQAKRQRVADRASGAFGHAAGAATGAAGRGNYPATGPVKAPPPRAPRGARPMFQLPGNLCACACGGAECNYAGESSEICCDMSTPTDKCCKACRLRQSKAWDYRYLNKVGNGQQKAFRSACWLNQNDDVRENFAGREKSYVRRFFPNYTPAGSARGEEEEEEASEEDFQ